MIENDGAIGGNKILIPGMLVRTNYNYKIWRTRTALWPGCNIWRRFVYESGVTGFTNIGNVVQGQSKPYVYIGKLAEDGRFAEILMEDSMVVVRCEILEIYE